MKAQVAAAGHLHLHFQARPLHLCRVGIWRFSILASTWRISVPQEVQHLDLDPAIQLLLFTSSNAGYQEAVAGFLREVTSRVTKLSFSISNGDIFQLFFYLKSGEGLAVVLKGGEKRRPLDFDPVGK